MCKFPKEGKAVETMLTVGGRVSVGLLCRSGRGVVESMERNFRGVRRRRRRKKKGGGGHDRERRGLVVRGRGGGNLGILVMVI